MDKKRKVQKKDGKVENFDPEKFKKSMQKAAIDAGYLLEGNVDLTLVDVVADDMDLELPNEDEIKSETIREIILKKLEKIDSAVAKAWRNFEKKYKS